MSEDFGDANRTVLEERRTFNDKSYEVRPLMINQVLKATRYHSDANFVLDGHELCKTISVVGSIREIKKPIPKKEDPNASTYWRILRLDDGYGVFDVCQWFDREAFRKMEEKDELSPNQYIKVHGNLSISNSRYHRSKPPVEMKAIHVQRVEDPHEIFHHILDAMRVTLIMELGPPLAPQAQISPSQTTVTEELKSSKSASPATERPSPQTPTRSPLSPLSSNIQLRAENHATSKGEGKGKAKAEPEVFDISDFEDDLYSAVSSEQPSGPSHGLSSPSSSLAIKMFSSPETQTTEEEESPMTPIRLKLDPLWRFSALGREIYMIITEKSWVSLYPSLERSRNRPTEGIKLNVICGIIEARRGIDRNEFIEELCRLKDAGLIDQDDDDNFYSIK